MVVKMLEAIMIPNKYVTITHCLKSPHCKIDFLDKKFDFSDFSESMIMPIYITKIICVCVCNPSYLRNPLTYDREILCA